MQPQKLCLKWNNHTANLLTVIGGFQQRDVLVDVTISCEGHNIKAHKMILSACSPYFQNIFLENPCQHPIVIINGFKYEDITAILNFMYKGEVNVSQDGLTSFLQAAEALKVKGLAEVCGEKRSTNSSSQEVQQSEQPQPQQQQNRPQRTETPPRKRHRNRKRSLSDSNRSDDEGSTRKQHREPSSPEIHELSGDESFTGDTNSNGPPFNTTPRVPQNVYSRSHQSSSNLADDDDEFEVEPSKLLEQTLTTDSVSMNNSSVDNKLRIERIMGNAEMESSSLQEPESPPDIKPIIDYGDSSAGPSEGSLMLYNEQSQPGPSSLQDGSLLHDNAHAQDVDQFLLWNIKLQNNQILKWIKHQERAKQRSFQLCPLDIPVRLPVDTIEDFLQFDHYLDNKGNFYQMYEYISSRGGRALVSAVNENLRHMMTNRLAASFNYKGTRGKNSFEATNANSLIIRAVKKSNGASESDIIAAIKIWLKHAPQRYSLSKKLL